MYNVVCNDINFLIFVNSTFSKNKGESMDKKSTLQILDSVNEELQGKMKKSGVVRFGTKKHFYCRAGKL